MSTPHSMSSDERPVILDEEANEIGYIAEDGSNIINVPRYYFTDEWVKDEQKKFEDFLNRITTPHRGFKYGDKL